jgi:hypothetical protein
MKGAAAAFAMLLATGCGGAPPVPPPPGSPMLTLGGFEGDGGSFVPLVDGADATLVEGAQGGFHVWMEFRLANAPAEHVDVTRLAHRVSDNALVLRAVGTYDIPQMPPGQPWESPEPARMFMCPSPIGIRVVDEQIRYDVSFGHEEGTDANGMPIVHEVAHGTITLVPRCPDAQRDFCLRICSG